MANALIVPIDVAALCVSQSDVEASDDTFGSKDLAEISADFSELPRADSQAGFYLSESVLPSPFSKVRTPLPAGIHLHWALPDALTRGATSGDPVNGAQSAGGRAGGIVFPEVPDRWLVVRIVSSPANAAAPSLEAWIVESDYLWDPAGEQPGGVLPGGLAQNSMRRAVALDPSGPTIPSGPAVWTRMGRAYRYAEWPGESGNPRQYPHTALGYGIPDFAAAYPHCVNVFGLYDDLATLPAGAAATICYAVIGWYADPSKDPLPTFQYPAGTEIPDPTVAGDKASLLQQHFKWSFDAAPVLPDRIVCSGILRGVPWDPNSKYLQQRAAADIQVAIGNTTAEAVAALLQRACPDVANLEMLMNYFQLGLLDRLKTPGGAIEIDDALHQSGFAHTQGGTIWVLKPKPAAASQAASSAQVEATPPPPAVVADLLNALNTEQQACDALVAEIAARQSQIYCDWYRFMLLRYGKTGDHTDPVQAIDFIASLDPTSTNSEITDLNARIAAQDPQQKRIAAAYAALASALHQAGDAWVAIQTGAPRYWQPAEPVVVLAGSDVNPPRRYGQDGWADPNGNVDNRGKLACRLSGQVVTAMSVAGATVVAAGLPNLTPLVPGNGPDEIGALIGEALLLAQAGAANAGPVTFTGTAPSPVGLVTWSQPWFPMLLQWEAILVPVQPAGGTSGDYPPGLIAGKFQFDADQIELTAKATPSGQGIELVPFGGTAILTGNSAINLRYQLDRYLEQYPDDPNADALGKVRAGISPSAMAQALSGFNQALLMRKQTLQLPVADPRANDDDTGKTGSVVAPAVASHNDVAPSPYGPFNPLRAGVLQLTSLRVIDTFGQWFDLSDPEIIVARSLQPPQGQGDSAIALPARLAQPSRLLFRWVSADDDQVETNAHPATTPLFGWVLFNHLDDNLMIYDVDGTALGSINLHGPVWQGAPGNDATYGWSPDSGEKLPQANHLLGDFVQSICTHAGFADFLQDFLAAIDAAMATTSPAGYQEDQGLALLIGQPLALVRASLRLELEGLPALDQGWAAFYATVTAYENATGLAGVPWLNRAHAGLTKDPAKDPAAGSSANTGVTFPIRLGEAARLEDGLVGYFINGDYGTFHALAGADSGRTGVVAADPFAIQLAPVPAIDTDPSNSRTLTMLVDPRGSVHATTGILPTKAISLPPDMYSAALRRIAVTFLTTPVILTPPLAATPSSPAGTRFPVTLPDESEYDWRWVTRDRDEWSAAPHLPGAGAKATFASPQRLVEGWLKLVRKPPEP